ncbi:MAG: 2Fe-2S iron-sulfur cluster binding domain-containing protein [Chloroflexota bacterium]|nr:MAG: 2Fe-2S iron-sulfur cluster binding domain-containing protein [Chloroflexota bacterium]
MDTVAVTLNGSPAVGPAGISILELAREQGIQIPTLCFHSELSLAGACRLCVVEVSGSRTLVASCHTPIASNMVIQTHSPRVLKARTILVELLLASHSGNCWSCDKANICELRQIAADLGVGLPRFHSRKRHYALEEAGPYLVRDLNKCVQCRRCVRACREIKGAGLLSMAYRGFYCKLVAGADGPLEAEICRDCGECVAVCPVGALTRTEERFVRNKETPLVVTGG